MNRRKRKELAKLAGMGSQNIGVLLPPDITPWVREYKAGRNDKCPCGQNKKYKDCCMWFGTYENYK
jgi:uncharacterized protein YecA (UPF0149 family)